MNNPTKNGACNWENRVRADWKTFPPQFGKLIDMRVISTPNGMSYGKPGWVPSDHVLHCQYERGHKTFDGHAWAEKLA